MSSRSSGAGGAGSKHGYHESSQRQSDQVFTPFENLVYDALTVVFKALLRVFFREIRVRGSHLVPRHGPVIFVIAPHANQFVDPVMLNITCKRRVGFLAAQKSMDRPHVGRIARMIQSIGVTRAQDIAVKGPGKVKLHPDHACTGEDPTTWLMGEGTNFTKDVKIGMSVMLPKTFGTASIVQIVSDTEIMLNKPFTAEGMEALRVGCTYKIIPHVDQTEMFSKVHERLYHGGCIGIFPEGGSHDRTDLLPLKAGVAISTLGAMSKYPSMDVKIIPVGLSYFNPHKFRSRACVEYGHPLAIPKELVRSFEEGGKHKRAAIAALLETIEASLRMVTVTAPDYQTLLVIQAVRRLYKPLNHKLTVLQKLEMTRRLIKGYVHFRDDARVRDLEYKVLYYNDLLQIHGLMDHQVRKTAIHGARAFAFLVYRLVLLLIMLIFAMPGGVLNAPIMFLSKIISKQKQKEALAASSVKLEGRDVLATWKLLVTLGVWPLLNGFYALCGWMLALFYFEIDTRMWFLGGPLAFILVQILSYVALQTRDRWIDIYRSLAPLFYSIFPTRWSTAQDLRAVRSQLERDINQVINELGPALFPDFELFFLRDKEIRSKSEKEKAGLTSRVSSWVGSFLKNYQVPQLWDLTLSSSGSLSSPSSGGLENGIDRGGSISSIVFKEQAPHVTPSDRDLTSYFRETVNGSANSSSVSLRVPSGSRQDAPGAEGLGGSPSNIRHRYRGSLDDEDEGIVIGKVPKSDPTDHPTR